MTRKKEILKAAQEYAKHKDIDLCLIPLAEQNAFYSGAEWADKTMIEKAAEWLRNSGIIRDNSGGYERECKIEEFCKAMEG